MQKVTSRQLFQELVCRQTWLRVFTYLLFIFSTFSIAGIDAAIILLYLTLLYHRLREPIADSLPWWMVTAFALLPAVAVLSALANGLEAPLPEITPGPDVLSNLAKLRGFYRVILPLALLPALGLVNGRNLLLTLLVFAGLMALYGVVQFRWGVDLFRPEGRKLITPYPGSEGIYHANGNFSLHHTFAGVMLMLSPLFASLARDGSGRERWIWGVGAVLAAVGVVVSLSRGGWLGLGVGLLLAALRFPRRIVAPLVVLAVLLGLSGTLLSTGWLRAQFAGPEQSALVKRFLSISPSQNRERLYLWESALMGIRDRPLLGVGYGNDKYYAPPYREEIAERSDFTFLIGLETHMHNVYLQTGFELGLLGLIGYLLWWGAIFRWNRMWLIRAGARLRFERALLYGTSGGLAGILATGFFEANFFDSEVQTMMMILMGLSLHAGLKIRSGTAHSYSPN